ncbi:hypothetical protein YC2023_020910 [Brassica napus]
MIESFFFFPSEILLKGKSPTSKSPKQWTNQKKKKTQQLKTWSAAHITDSNKPTKTRANTC